MYRYIVCLIFYLLTSYTQAQNAIALELTNRSIDEFQFPIKIGDVTSELESKIVGYAKIQELDKFYPLQFEDSVHTEIKEYIDFLQLGESFLDTVHLNIKRLEIKERIQANIEESRLLLDIEFYTLKNGQKKVVDRFSDLITVSDENITVFHEYNIRKGINEALKWFTNQYSFTAFKAKEFPKSYRSNFGFIEAHENTDIYSLNDTLIYNFQDIERLAISLNDKEINRIIRTRKGVSTVGGIIAVSGLMLGLVGYVDYKYGSNPDIQTDGKLMAGGLVGLLLGGAIASIGEKRYESKIVQRYNRIQYDKNQTVFTPYNPINIAFTIPLR